MLADGENDLNLSRINPLTDPDSFDWVCLCPNCARVSTFSYNGAAPNERFPTCDLCGARAHRDDIIENGYHRQKVVAEAERAN